MTKIHIGCGTNVLEGWINVDCVSRAPGVHIDMDLAQLPFEDGTVSAVLAEHVFEHFSLAEESQVWNEMARVLQPGGILEIEVPDFEWICRTFLAAHDVWKDFYIVGRADHYCGFGRSLVQRWGIIQTMFFGNQNGVGQFHRTGYTEGKIRGIGEKLGFVDVQVSRRFHKGGQALRAILVR